MEPPPPQQNPPKDGFGPRGYPDCYYTSRVLDSTFRYVKFIKKLRALEEEQRRGAENALKDLKDKQYSDFFIRCDRRSLINNVARRVNLCMSSYQEDLKAKRQRLTDMLAAEEEMNIRKFVEQAQAGTAALWQDKKDRLAYLLAKRQKEHEDKYKDIPLSKCVHVHPCLVKMRAKESAEFQKYQIIENQYKKMAQKEIDNMWHEVAMKESEALAARMELDAIERRRRDNECKDYTDQQIALRKQQRTREQELLKQETLKMKALFEENTRKEEEEERQRQEKRLETARERKAMIEERKATLAKQEAQTNLINNTWDSLAGMGLADEKAKEERMRQKERDLDVCNKKMAALQKEKLKTAAADDILLKQEAEKQQEVTDKRRCELMKKSQKLNADARTGIVEQMKERAAKRVQNAQHKNDEQEYQRQLHEQLDLLVKHKRLTDAQARKLHQKNLLEQIDYNKLLKERAMQEELEQRKKCQIATDEYQRGIQKMLCRNAFSDEIHPFMKQMMKGLKMKDRCPCTLPDYCAIPQASPETAATSPKTAPAATSPKTAPAATSPKTVAASPGSTRVVSPSK